MEKGFSWDLNPGHMALNACVLALHYQSLIYIEPKYEVAYKLKAFFSMNIIKRAMKQSHITSILRIKTKKHEILYF
jgi:hypothetical protein